MRTQGTGGEVGGRTGREPSWSSSASKVAASQREQPFQLGWQENGDGFQKQGARPAGTKPRPQVVTVVRYRAGPQEALDGGPGKGAK